MPESIIAKFGAYIVDGLLWIIGVLFALLGGFLWYKWKRHEGRVDTIAEKVSNLENTVVYRSDLDNKADEIRAEVRVREARSFLFGWGQWGSLPDADILEIERIIKAALATKEPQP